MSHPAPGDAPIAAPAAEGFRMSASALCCGLLAFAAAVVLGGGGVAHAQSNRTFVSGQGSDSNPCSLSAPCRSFTQALSQTNAGGEITILDPAGYGSVNITKSVSIVNDGVGEAGITASSGDGIDINAGPADVINLRGLTFVGTGGGSNAISFNTGGTLNIQNCAIREFNSGLLVAAQGSKVSILDTSVFAATGGVITHGGGAPISMFADKVTISGPGFIFFGNVTGIIANSAVIGSGVDILPFGSTLLVLNSSFVGPGTGVNSGGGGGIYIGGSSFTGNEPPFLNYTNAVPNMHSYGNNSVVGGSGGDTPAGVATR